MWTIRICFYVNIFKCACTRVSSLNHGYEPNGT